MDETVSLNLNSVQNFALGIFFEDKFHPAIQS